MTQRICRTGSSLSEARGGFTVSTTVATAGFFHFLYLFDITAVQDRIMVSLEQHDVKGREAMLGQMNTIGFHIMKVGLYFLLSWLF